MERMDRRGDAQPRPLTLIPNFVETADGSCLITAGKTRVICTASVEEGVPPFLRGEGRGWVTAEYAMLPASTGRRKARDGIKKDGRGVEIQRLIGRSLRQAVDMRLWASGPSRWTAMFCRPTAARARRPSRAHTWRW